MHLGWAQGGTLEPFLQLFGCMDWTIVTLLIEISDICEHIIIFVFGMHYVSMWSWAEGKSKNKCTFQRLTSWTGCGCGFYSCFLTNALFFPKIFALLVEDGPWAIFYQEWNIVGGWLGSKPITCVCVLC